MEGLSQLCSLPSNPKGYKCFYAQTRTKPARLELVFGSIRVEFKLEFQFGNSTQVQLESPSSDIIYLVGGTIHFANKTIIPSVTLLSHQQPLTTSLSSSNQLKLELKMAIQDSNRSPCLVLARLNLYLTLSALERYTNIHMFKRTRSKRT